MIRTVKARFIEGVLKPLEHLEIEEGTEVIVSVDDAVMGATDSSPDWKRRVAARGRAIYEGKIRHLLEDSSEGELVVIDTKSGDYEIDIDDAAATSRLLERHPEAVTYAVRIGHRTPFRTGLRGTSQQ